MAQDPSILVIGPRWVGDMVMAQCLFSALRERYPDAAIDVMVPGGMVPVARRMPEIRRCIEDPFPRGRLSVARRRQAGHRLRNLYSDAYVMQGNWKAALVPYFAGIPRRVGYRKEWRYGLLTDILPLPDDLKRRTARMFFNMAGGGSFRPPRLSVDGGNRRRLLDEHGLAEGGYVALMPGAEFGPAKRWPSASYASFASEMMRRGFEIVLLGSPNDAPVGAEIAAAAPGVMDLTGQTRLEDAIDLISGARLAVSNDSGLMHVAAAVGVPVIAVYGSTSPKNTPPLAERRELVWLELECSPCHRRECPLGHFNCMNTLEPALVTQAADRLLGPDAHAA